MFRSLLLEGMGYLTVVQVELLIPFAPHDAGRSFALADATAQGGSLLSPWCILPACRLKLARIATGIAAALANLAPILADFSAHLRALLACIGSLWLQSGFGVGHKCRKAGQGQRKSRVMPFAFHYRPHRTTNTPCCPKREEHRPRAYCVNPLARERRAFSITDLDVEAILARALF